MSSENLARLADGGKLKAEPPSRKDFQGLLKLGRARLADSRKDLSIESRFDLAGSTGQRKHCWRRSLPCPRPSERAGYPRRRPFARRERLGAFTRFTPTFFSVRAGTSEF